MSDSKSATSAGFAFNLSGISCYMSGLAAVVIVALAAKFIEGYVALPALMIALIFGLALNFVSDTPVAKPGVQFSAKHVLAAGVALLGIKLTFSDVAAIGWHAAVTVAAAMAITILASVLLAKAFGLSRQLGILAGCGTAICGASAAVATASIFKKSDDLDRDTALVVITVVALSAVAMLVYPFIAQWLLLNDTQAGIVLGGSIHNVPQAVGAGYSFSEKAGDTATLTKLYRVALLAPIILTITLLLGRQSTAKRSRVSVPWFVIVFAALIIIGSIFEVPDSIRDALAFASNWLLLIAIAAIGMNTSLTALRSVGGRALVLVFLNSLVLLGMLIGAALLGIL